MQGDERAGNALVSLDGQVEEIPLAAFGQGPRGPERATLRAVFGFPRKTGRVAGRLRNFVVSSPGRYLRAWMRAEAPTAAPVLQLGFVTQERVTAGVRFRVRYGHAQGGRDGAARCASPRPRSSSTMSKRAARCGSRSRCTAARAATPLLLTLERDSLHPDDTLPTSIRLVSAALAAGPAR